MSSSGSSVLALAFALALAASFFAAPALGAGLLRRQDHRASGRRAARRRLRHLRPHGGAPSRPPHPRQPDHRGQEHAGRQQRQGRAIHQRHRAQGRHQHRRRSCRARSWAPCSTSAPRRCSIRPRCSYIGTANSGTRVCVTLKGTKIATFDDTRKVQGAKFGSSGPERLHLRIRPPAPPHLRRDLRRGRGLSRHRRHGARASSAARSTACAAGTGRASSRRSRTGCATTRPTCCFRSASTRIRS